MVITIRFSYPELRRAFLYSLVCTSAASETPTKSRNQLHFYHPRAIHSCLLSNAKLLSCYLCRQRGREFKLDFLNHRLRPYVDGHASASFLPISLVVFIIPPRYFWTRSTGCISKLRSVSCTFTLKLLSDCNAAHYNYGYIRVFW